MNTTRKIISTVMWLARGAATGLGLVLMLGVATTANAAPGDPLALGKVNTIKKITRLAGGADSAMLSITNDSTASSATVLNLHAEPGKLPMSVSSGAGKATMEIAC